MSEVLARLRVKEEHGIRRFLYPLTAVLPGRAEWQNRSVFGKPVFAAMRVAETDGRLLPSQLRGFSGHSHRLAPHIDFAVSLAPHEMRDLIVVATPKTPEIPDPLSIRHDLKSGLVTHQERVSFGVGPDSLPEADGTAKPLAPDTALRSVIYDGQEHLAGPLAITLTPTEPLPNLPFQSGLLNGNLLWAVNAFGRASSQGHLKGQNYAYETRYDFTACKSWVLVTHSVRDAPAGATVTFSLPLMVQVSDPVCDFGNGVYAKIGPEGVRWTTEIVGTSARWRISTVIHGEERIDYEGETKTASQFKSQAWFHWIEQTKALGVAITVIPPSCTRLDVLLNADGKIVISYLLGPSVPRNIQFGVCYHFLNDIPAIAAATNPQSILLPPTVEVLPA